MTAVEPKEFLHGMVWTPSVYPDVAAYLLKREVESVYHAACGKGDLLLMLKRAGIRPTHLCGCDLIPSDVDTAQRRTGLEDIVINDFGNPKLVIPRRTEAVVLIGCLPTHNGQPVTEERLGRIADNLVDTLKRSGIVLFNWEVPGLGKWLDILKDHGFRYLDDFDVDSICIHVFERG